MDQLVPDRPAVAIMLGGPHPGRWEMPEGGMLLSTYPDEGGFYALTRRFGEQYRGRPPVATKDGGLYEWRRSHGR